MARMADPLRVFLHNSVPGRNMRHSIWSAKVSRLGLQLTKGDIPEPGTRIAVVGDEPHFQPFSAEAALLLRSLSEAAVQPPSKDTSQLHRHQPQQQQEKQQQLREVPSSGTAVVTSETLSPTANTATKTTTATATTRTAETTRMLARVGRAPPRPAGSARSRGGTPPSSDTDGARRETARGGRGAPGLGRASGGHTAAAVPTGRGSVEDVGGGAGGADGQGAGTKRGPAAGGQATRAVLASVHASSSAQAAHSATAPCWLSSGTWTSWPPLVMLVSEQWLVDCVGKRSLLDPTPYDVRQRPTPRRPVAAAAAAEPPPLPTLKAPAREGRTSAEREGCGSGELPEGYGNGNGNDGRVGATVGAGAGEGAIAAVSAAAVAMTSAARGVRPEKGGLQRAKRMRPWVPPRLAQQVQRPLETAAGTAAGRAAVVVGEAPQPLGWWDPTRGSFVLVPDHLGRPRPEPQQADGSCHEPGSQNPEEGHRGAGEGEGASAAAGAPTGDGGAAMDAETGRPGPLGTSGGGSSGGVGAGCVAPTEQRWRLPIVLRVVSYNVLGNTTCMTSPGELRKLPLAHREMSYRGPRLLQELKGYDADVICLQEVDASVFQLWLHPWAVAEGYHITFLPRGATRPLEPTGLPPAPRFNPFAGGSGGGSGAKRRRGGRRTGLPVVLGDYLGGIDGGGANSGEADGADGVTLESKDGTSNIDFGGGGGGHFPRETDGLALLVRRRSLRVVALRCEELSQRLPGGGDGGGGGSGGGDAAVPADSFWQTLRNRGVVAILALLQPVSAPHHVAGSGGAGGGGGASHGGDGGHVPVRHLGIEGQYDMHTSSGVPGYDTSFVVGTTHLWWDPRLPHVKSGEAHQLCRTVVGFLADHGFERPQDVPLVLCGDWNTRWLQFQSDRHDRVAPGGCLVGGVYELLTHGSLGVEHPHHPSARGYKAEEVELHTSGLRLASSHLIANGREPAATVISRRFRACLDYLWLSRGHWSVTATLDMPYWYGSDPRADDGRGSGGAGRFVRTPLANSSGDDIADGVGAGGGEGDSGTTAHGGAEGLGAGDRGGGRGGEPQLQGMPGCGPVWGMATLPNAEWPSDHLAIGAELRMNG